MRKVKRGSRARCARLARFAVERLSTPRTELAGGLGEEGVCEVRAEEAGGPGDEYFLHLAAEAARSRSRAG